MLVLKLRQKEKIMDKKEMKGNRNGWKNKSIEPERKKINGKGTGWKKVMDRKINGLFWEEYF